MFHNIQNQMSRMDQQVDNAGIMGCRPGPVFGHGPPRMQFPNQIRNMAPLNRMNNPIGVMRHMDMRMDGQNQICSQVQLGNQNMLRLGQPRQMRHQLGLPNQIEHQMRPQVCQPNQMGPQMRPQVCQPNQMGPQMRPQVCQSNQMGPRIGLPLVHPNISRGNQIQPRGNQIQPCGNQIQPCGNQIQPRGNQIQPGMLPNKFGSMQTQPQTFNQISNRMPPPITNMNDPLRNIFRIPNHQELFSLAISNIPADISACELWGWMAGERGLSQGVLLIQTPEHPESTIGIAVFRTHEDLIETMIKLKRKHQYIKRYSVPVANDLLNNVENASRIFLSTTERTDRLLSIEMRIEMGIGNVCKHPPQNKSINVHPAKPILAEETKDWESVTAVFPMPDKDDQFYLKLTNLKDSTTACELMLYFTKMGIQTPGIVLAKVPDKNKLCSQAFALFRSCEEAQFAIGILKEKQKNLSLCKSADAKKFVDNLPDNALIFISTAAGKDRMLMLSERGVLRDITMKTPSLSTTSDVMVDQATVNATLLGNSSKGQILENENKIDDSFSNAKPEEVTKGEELEQLTMIYPVPNNKAQLYIKFDKLEVGMNACKLSTLLNDYGCKAEGVLSAWNPTNIATSSRAYALYHCEANLLKAMKIVKIMDKDRQISQCSSAEANNFFSTLDDKSTLFISVDVGKVIVVTATDRKKLEENSWALFSVEDEDVEKTDNAMHLLPNLSLANQYYLGLSNLPLGHSACTIWSWFGGALGKSKGVVLGSVPPVHRFFTSLAFAVFNNVDDVEEAMQNLKSVHEFRARYSSSDVTRFLEGISDEHCQIFISTLQGIDELVTLNKSAAVEDHSITFEDKELISQLLPNETSRDIKIATTVPLLRSIFPVPDGKDQFYLGISKFPKGISASGLWSCIGGKNGPAQGVILFRCNASDSLPPKAFIAFQSEENLLKANVILKPTTATVAQFSNKRLKAFLDNLSSSCTILVTSSNGGDRELDHSEIKALCQSQKPENENRKSEEIDEKNVETYPQTWKAVKSIFPSPENTCQYFIQLSNLKSDITASDLWKWLRKMGGKTDGVVLAKIYPESKNSCNAFAVFRTWEDRQQLMASLKSKQHNISTCSVEEAYLVLTSLKSGYLVFISTEAGKDRMLLNVEKLTLKMDTEQSSTSEGQLVLKRDQTNVSHHDGDDDDKNIKRRKTESECQINDWIIQPKQFTNQSSSQGMERKHYLELLPIPDDTAYFYIGISHFQSNSSASQLWLHLNGISKKSICVVLRQNSVNSWSSSLAFAVFNKEDDMKQALNELKLVVKQASQYSSTMAYNFFMALPDSCPIHISTDTGSDLILTAEECLAYRNGDLKQMTRSGMHLGSANFCKKNDDRDIKDSLLNVIARMGGNAPNTIKSDDGNVITMIHQDKSTSINTSYQEQSNCQELQKQMPGIFSERQAVISKVPLGQSPVTHIEDKSFLNSELLLMFPSFSPTSKFYLGILGTTQAESPSQIWEWVCNGEKIGDGIILCCVPSNRATKSCAFIVFNNKQTMLEVEKNCTVLKGHTAEWSLSDVNNYLHSLDNSCQIFVASMYGADTMLTLSDRENMGFKLFHSPQPVSPLVSQRQRAPWEVSRDTCGPWN